MKIYWARFIAIDNDGVRSAQRRKSQAVLLSSADSSSDDEREWLLFTEARVGMRLGMVIQSCCVVLWLSLSVEELWETKF